MIYIFQCQSCNNNFEINKSIHEISGFKPSCPECSSNDTYRDYSAENKNFFGPQKTLGSFADKNKMSSEAQQSLLNKNKEKGQLPDGMSRFERDGSGNIIP